MSFDRYRAQTLCENLLGCADFNSFRLSNFETLTLNRADAYAFRNSLQEDASDFYYKGYLTLLDSLNSFQNRNYSWAIIKGYYSVFYMIKADLAIRDYGLIRHKAIYYLEAKDGATPVTKGIRGNNRSNYSGDHKSAINYYKDLFNRSDILLSQNIDGLNAYEWLMKKREQVNYQERYFNEPKHPSFLEYIDNQIQSGNFINLVSEIINDNTFVKTFQNEFAPLAIPIKRTLLTKKNFANNGIEINFTSEQIEYLKNYSDYLIIENS
ncbi:hypothetical protein [Flavobacterium sp. S87F.05.LMB.W.Kidney.N]|uniref:hypothetical protein n=1 Tax=Flavobacterium sp. S87F.05.LMB.W.Kidney.N TaxID=1278758 RepID=UPI001066230F|nr:hypothetical protein [Flavobacterium sp. S87F.05.LMB.W.Kidney.N]TDX12684.1 hypothetical protein EDB96_1760 [Flavobacterium sp. S87F.05.LMB.W.Kidney.N]